jgi:hypothetical protein
LDEKAPDLIRDRDCGVEGVHHFCSSDDGLSFDEIRVPKDIEICWFTKHCKTNIGKYSEVRKQLLG